MLKKITKQIYISGRDEIDDFDALKKAGITAILNVAWEVNDFTYPPDEFLMVKVGLLDGQGNPQFLKALAVMALRNLVEQGHVVVVHCMAGASRSPYVVFRYLCEKEHRTMEAIYQEFRAQYSDILISPLNYE